MAPKNKPNGFLIFANEIRNMLQNEGYIIRNTPALIQAASPKWELLTDEEKQYYKDTAKWNWTNRDRSKGSNYRNPARKDCTGAVMSERVDMVKIHEMKQRKEREEVISQWPAGRDVLDLRFYFVAFICLLEEPEYQALEVAAVCFSLNNGIEKTWHRYISPGPIPTGYRFQAQQTSELTHKMPVEGIATANDTYMHVYDELIEFLTGDSQHIPPIHVKISELERTKGSLRWLALKAGRANSLKRIYELEGLILDLESHLKNSSYFVTSIQLATDLLSSTVYDWDLGTRCKWHEESESKYCALASVKRCCFCISNYFCATFDIPLTENHLPVKETDTCYTVGSVRVLRTNINKKEVNVVADELAQRLLMRNVAKESEDVVDDDDDLEVTKKRWIDLRGGDVTAALPAPPGIPASTRADDFLNLIVGRGRGRGKWRSKASDRTARKPTMIEKRYAGITSASPPAQVPLPPAGWVN